MPDEWIVRRPWLKDRGIIGKQEFKEAEFRYQEPILLPTIDQSDTGLILLVEQSVSYTNTIYRSVCLLY